MTSVKIAKKDHKHIIENMMQLYLHDLSEFVKLEMDSQGRFLIDEYFNLYWVESDRYPYLIYHQGLIAGFAFVRGLGFNTWSIAEFFILQEHRKNSIGSSAATQLFALHPGRWHIAQLESNTLAQSFWLKVINTYTQGKFENTWSKDSPKGPMIVFNATARTSSN